MTRFCQCRRCSGSDVLTPAPDLLGFAEHRKVEGSHAAARQTAELLRSVVSQHRMGSTNQAAALADTVRAFGEQLIAANPIGALWTFQILIL
jgi:translation initiation factor eIF-2B subunit beta